MLNVTNSTDLTTVLGISFDPSSPAILLEYSIVNIVATSVIPVPVAGPLTAVAAALFGLVGGMAINVGTSVVGAWLGLLAVRHACRPCFMRMLGRYHEQWKALDAALTAQGYQVALLIRLAPVAPMVLTNILLSLTSLPLGTYLWTCAIGIVPANLPYAYAAELGISLSEEFPPKDPVMLTMTIIGFVASVGIAWKVHTAQRWPCPCAYLSFGSRHRHCRPPHAVFLLGLPCTDSCLARPCPPASRRRSE
jgi:uncharacterized membrane protein YdjX (TVP38/TMEM64 family)